MAADRNGAAAEWRANWKVVLAAVCGLVFVAMPNFMMGVFIPPLEKEFGWSRAQISSVLIAMSVVGVFLGPFLGVAIDRVGPRRIGLVGVVLVCGMLALLSTATPSLLWWWALWVAFALCWLFTLGAVWLAGVSSLFAAGRGLALATTLCGSSIAMIGVPIISNYFIQAFGWRMAYVSLSAIFALIVAPPIFLFFSSAHDRARNQPGRDRTAKNAPLKGASAREAMTSSVFVRLSTATFLMVLCAPSLSINLVPILMANGHSSTLAASIAGLLGITAIVGRLSTGFLLDRFNAGILAACSIAGPTIPCLLLIGAPGSAPIAILAVLLLGLSLGAELDVVSYLTARHFGLRSFGTIIATIAGFQTVASGIGPTLANHIYDVTGSYRVVLLATIPLSLVAAALFLSLGSCPALEGTPDKERPDAEVPAV